MFVVRPGRLLSSAALFCVAVPAVAAAQAPLAGLVSRVIAESTINRSQPNQPVVHEPHFLVGESLARSARQMNVELGAQLLSFPLGSSSGGFSFTTNSMTGEVSMSSETFGPAFAERAITLGKGQTNIGFAFQSTSYDSFEGVALDSGGLSFIRQHNDCCPATANNPTQPTNFDAGIRARPAAVQPVAGHQLARQRALRDLWRDRQLRPRHRRAVRARGPRRAGRRPHLPHRVRRQLADPQLRHRRRRSRHVHRERLVERPRRHVDPRQVQLRARRRDVVRRRPRSAAADRRQGRAPRHRRHAGGDDVHLLRRLRPRQPARQHRLHAVER